MFGQLHKEGEEVKKNLRYPFIGRERRRLIAQYILKERYDDIDTKHVFVLKDFWVFYMV
jgi:hypothetical protein